jgi:hypothetical protein
MRKTIILPCKEGTAPEKPKFLDLESLAQVEITSEDPEYPIESALLDCGQSGWRASTPGEQTIRLIFDQPVDVKHIYLQIEETGRSRTQEFVLLWLRHGDRNYHEILRQQFHFSPPGTCQQFEQYDVDLKLLKILKLKIIADISDNAVLATLKKIRLA